MTKAGLYLILCGIVVLMIGAVILLNACAPPHRPRHLCYDDARFCPRAAILHEQPQPLVGYGQR